MGLRRRSCGEGWLGKWAETLLGLCFHVGLPGNHEHFFIVNLEIAVFITKSVGIVVVRGVGMGIELKVEPQF